MIDEAPRADAAAQPERQEPPHGHVADARLPRLRQLKTRSLNGSLRDLEFRVHCAHGRISLRAIRARIIAAHARGLAGRGTTDQEVAEALGVTIAMNGGPGTVWAPRARAAFQEFAAEG